MMVGMVIWNGIPQGTTKRSHCNTEEIMDRNHHNCADLIVLDPCDGLDWCEHEH